MSVARVLATMLLWGSKENRVVGVGLDVLLQVLGTLESLSAEVTFVWLERDVDANVGGDMIALDSGGTAGVPSAGEVQVVGALSADMLLADVLLKRKVSFAHSLLLPQRRDMVCLGKHIRREPLQMCISRCTYPIGMRGCRPQRLLDEAPQQ